MKRNPTWIPVVAAAVRDEQGRILLQRRPPEKHHGGLWEFPGGKVESGEIPRLALAREVLEELAITLDPDAMAPLAFADEGGAGDRPGVVLFLYDCPVWSGTAQGLEGQEFGWFAFGAASGLQLAPMDRILLAGFAP